jgi:hypothetical protein
MGEEMTRILAAGLALALSLSFTATAAVPSMAAPLRLPAPAAVETPTEIVQVGNPQRRYDRHGHYRPHVRYRRDNHVGPLIGGLLAGAIIGTIIANPPPRYYGGHGSPHVDWCLRRYRSYDVYSNTFQPYHGPRRICRSPYAY